MRDNGIQNRLPLTVMKIQAACGLCILTKPPMQQFRCGRCHQIKNIGNATFQADTQLPGFGSAP